MVYGKLVSGKLVIAPSVLTYRKVTYNPATEAIYLKCGYKPLQYENMPENEHFYTSAWTETDDAIVQSWEIVTVEPDIQRERAYQTRLCCEWGDEVYTVDHMVDLYTKYAAEGSPRASEIAAIIAAAKARIREDYPDEA